MSTQTQEEQIHAGNAAEELLGSEAFTGTIDELVQATFAFFVNSEVQDTEGRERAFTHYRAINDIAATLQQRVQVRDGILESIADDENANNKQ